MRVRWLAMLALSVLVIACDASPSSPGQAGSVSSSGLGIDSGMAGLSISRIARQPGSASGSYPWGYQPCYIRSPQLAARH